jgi:uncharacterized protein (DUF983 family)
MDCTQCGHPYQHHDVGDEHRCRMRIAYEWNDKLKVFAKHAPCRCTGYRGVTPGDGVCPHEYVKTSPNCVYCGHVPSIWEKMR